MNYRDKKICRLCLDITPSCECEVIDEVKKKILKVLLINIDFDVSSNVVVCNGCLERLQNFYDFKSHCVTTCTNLVNEKICLEDSQICRLCSSMIEINTLNYTTDCDLRDEVPLKDVIGNCFPEVDFDTVRDPLLCDLCQGRVKEYNEFVRNCEKVEQRIHSYCQVGSHGTTGRINLEDMLKIRDHKVLGELTNIKEECSNLKIIDTNVKNEELYTIQCEEIHIKDEELDQGTKNRKSGQLQTDDGAGKKDASNSKIEEESEGKTHLCPKCPYHIRRRPRVETRVSSDQDKKICKCFLCPLLTATGLSREDTPSHKGPTKTFRCCGCSYETNRKDNLQEHLKIHEDPVVAKKFKCDECPFRCTQKASLKKHVAGRHTKLRQHRVQLGETDQLVDHIFIEKNRSAHEEVTVESSNEKKHLCPRCPNFNRMHLVKGYIDFDSDKETCKCPQCRYLTAAELSREDIRGHKGPTRTFGCCECSFETDHGYRMKRHFITHQSNLEIHMYKCTECKFQTKHKNGLVRHKKTHQDPNVAKKFKCEECPYQCIRRSTLKEHMDAHSMRQYRCDQCSYFTHKKVNLGQHKRFLHKIRVNVAVQCNQCGIRMKNKATLHSHKKVHDPTKYKFKCDQCAYCTYHGPAFRNHLLCHTKPGETVIIYYCATCDFRSKYKASLRRHIKICVKKEEYM